jgi:hypothetical protein
LNVHKEEEGLKLKLLGMEVGGHPPIVHGVREKMHLLYEGSLYLSRRGRGKASWLRMVIGFWTWFMLPCRPALAVFDEVYRFCEAFKDDDDEQELWFGVRKELAAAAALAPLLRAELSKQWSRIVYMMDASDLGAGIIATMASLEEVRAEAALSCFGGWHVEALPDGQEDQVLQAALSLPKVAVGPKVPTYVFWHIGGGFPTHHDLSDEISKEAARRGVLVLVRSVDVRGDGSDLLQPQVVQSLIAEMTLGHCDAIHATPPWSTWFPPGSRWSGARPVRPLRTSSFPWGSTAVMREGPLRMRLLKGSRLLLVALQLLTVASEMGLACSFEFPSDPSLHGGSQRAASPWRLSEVVSLLRLGNFKISSPLAVPTSGGGPLRMSFALPEDAEPLVDMGSKEETVKALAQRLVSSMLLRPPRVGELPTEGPLLDQLAATAQADLTLQAARKTRVPPMAESWDPIERWRELFRTRWRIPMHNNLLELEAFILSVRHFVKSLGNWHSRLLLFTDSQVVLGAVMKGRSSAPGILRGCRKITAMCLAYGLVLYLRYVPTARNHSDGPSRGGPIGVFQGGASFGERIRFGPWYQGGFIGPAPPPQSSSSSSQ